MGRLQVLIAVGILLLISRQFAEATSEVRFDEHQALSRVALHRSKRLLDSSVSISATPDLLGQKVTVCQVVNLMFCKTT